MAFRLSTGLRNAMLGTTGFKGALADGKIKVFTGSQPISADNAEQGTLLVEFTLDAGAFSHGAATNGLEFGTAASGAIAKATAEIWRGVAVAAGTAGWARFVANPTDSGGSSTTLARLDFTVGLSGSGADAILSDITLEVGQSVTCDTFTMTLPAS